MGDNLTQLGYNQFMDRSIGASQLTDPLIGTSGVNVGDSLFAGQTLSGNFVAYSGKIGGTDNYFNIAESDFAAIGSGDVAIRAAQPSYNTNTGFWLGRKNGIPKLSIGDGGISQYLTWDGSQLVVNGRTFVGNLLFGDGSDGTVTLGAGTTTLSRDMFYKNLTVPVGATLATNGFRIFVTTTCTIAGTIDNGGDGSTTVSNNGSAGGAGASKGTGGALITVSAFSSGSVWNKSNVIRYAQVGGDGGVGDTGAGAGTGADGIRGAIGTGGDLLHGAVASSAQLAGAHGGAGGAGGTTGSAGGAGGTSLVALICDDTITDSSPRNFGNLISNLSTNDQNTRITLYTPSPHGPGGTSGAGGGGGGRSSGSGGAGGGGGGGGLTTATGGTILICASNMILQSTAVLSSKGQNGGTGGKGGKGAAGSGGNAAGGGGGGGGAGGAGGGGGLIFLLYTNLTNNGATFAVDGGAAGAGGSGGAGGAGAGTGAAGTAGTSGLNGAAGVSGQYFLFQQK